MSHEYTPTPAALACADLPELAMLIEWEDGKTDLRYFDTCCDAWHWARVKIHKNAKRRAIADRRLALRSYYAGCTVTGKTYGGIFTGRFADGDDYPLRELKSRMYIRASRHALESGVIIVRNRELSQKSA
tara:strand:- start:3027 stop:3416 length:390 start_codon:yes stop_codon:yes gene_type:complete